MLSGSKILRKTARWIRPFLARPFGRPVALFFHGVVEGLSDPRIEINHHQLDDFRTIAVALKRRFNVLPIAALNDALERPERHSRTVFLMADDGYANTLALAAPVLEELRLAWTLFISTEHVETGSLNPLVLARLFVHFAPKGVYALPHLTLPVRLGTVQDRANLETSLLRELRKLPASNARNTVAAMEAAFPDGELDRLRVRFSSERYLSWSEVETLHRRGVTIGAHAHWHWPMNAAQSQEGLLLQARKPRELIASRLGECRYFAYPFGNTGDVSRSATEAVRDAGYSHAFSTHAGTLSAKADRWYLPRYGLQPKEHHLPALLPLLRIADLRRRANMSRPTLQESFAA